MTNISKKISVVMLAFVLGAMTTANLTYAAHLEVDLSESTAKALAQKLYKGSGSFTSIELETQAGLRVYAVGFTEKNGNEVDVKIDANTGKLVVIEDDSTDTEEDGDVEGTDDKDEQALLLPHVKLSEKEAKVLALKAYTGNGTLTQTELEDEKGVVVYGFKFTEANGTEVDIKIDAVTGAVVKSDDNQDEETDDGNKTEVGASNNASTSVSIAPLQAQLVSLLRQLIALLKA